MPESTPSSRCSPAVVVAAKLRVPPPPAPALARPRIGRLLQLGAARPLTVLSAPAGYGKTTAVAAWLRASDRPAAWVTLDARDDDPRRLWAHLLAALVPALADADALAEAQAALQAGEDLLEAVAPLTVEALARSAPPHLTVVLDDLHRVDRPAAHAAIAAFADAAPAGTHIVLSGRTSPPPDVGAGARPLTARQLRFRRSEAEELLNGGFGLALDAAQLDLVADRVEGWPACLRLVAAAFAEPPDDPAAFEAGFVRAHRLIADYLAEEVLDPLPAELRRLLRRGSLARQLTGPLAAALLDDPRGAALLDAAGHEHRLTWATEQDDRVRLHPLLATVLRQELEAVEPQLAPELHRRASRWHEVAGLPPAAIEHAAAAGDGRRAARLLHRAGIELLRDGRYDAVRRLVEGLAPDRGPFGPCSEALATLATLLDGADPAVVAERLALLDGDEDAAGVARLVAQTRAWPFLGTARASVRAGRRALALAEGEPETSRRWSAAMLGLALWFAGDGDAARELLEPDVDAIADRDAGVWARSALAFAASERGDDEEAGLHAHAAVALASGGAGRDAAPRMATVVAWHALAGVQLRQTQLTQADATLARAERLTWNRSGSLQHALTLALRAELRLARQERSAAARTAVAARRIADRCPDAGVLAVRLDALDVALAGRGDDVLLGSDPTPAERRVLELLPGDLSTAEIAAALYLSRHTVKSHQRRLYRRLGATTRADAVAAARARGLL